MIGASGNMSVRDGDSLLITPSAVPYADLTPELIVSIDLHSDDPASSFAQKPSSEWRFHRDLVIARDDLSVVIHTHAPACTALACARKPIPAVHYMIAAFGGNDIRVADYARFGTAELSAHIVAAMENRKACLMANHGMFVAADSVERALWLAYELEHLAQIYLDVLSIGGGHVLSQREIDEVSAAFSGYTPHQAQN